MNGSTKELLEKRLLLDYQPMVLMIKFQFQFDKIFTITILYIQKYVGRSFTLASPNLTDIGDPAIKGGLPGMYTKESGFLSFFEVWFFSYDFYSFIKFTYLSL